MIGKKCSGENIFLREIILPSCATEWFIRTMRKRRNLQSSSKPPKPSEIIERISYEN